MKRILLLSVVCVALLASAACADIVGLYSADDWQYFGTGANGGARSEHFCAISAEPNALDPMVTFDQAGFNVRVAHGDTLSFTLSLKPWDFNGYDASDAATPIAQKQFSLTSDGDYLCMLDPFEAQPAYGDYLLQMSDVNLVPTAASVGWGIERSSSNDGGAGNDAFNNNGIKTDREYQVYLNTTAVPEPASITVLGLGLLGLIRRKIRK